MLHLKIDLSSIEEIMVSPGASSSEVERVEKSMEVQFPQVLKKLLMYSNGLSIAGDLLFYATDEIVERNATWEVEEYAPGYLAIGDNGGGSVFLMLQGVTEKAVLIVDAGDMNPMHAIIVTSDFLAWLHDGCIAEELTTEELFD